MKTMKTVLMILLGAALVLSLAGVGAVAAEKTYTSATPEWRDGDTPTDGNITVSYTIGESYSVTIPPDVDFNTASTTSPNLNVQATLDTSSEFNVTVKSKNGWNMTFTDNEQKTYFIPYTLTIGGDTYSSPGSTAEVELYGLTNSGGNADLTMVFAITGEKTSLPTMSGTYTDTLTFTVNYRDTGA